MTDRSLQGDSTGASSDDSSQTSSTTTSVDGEKELALPKVLLVIAALASVTRVVSLVATSYFIATNDQIVFTPDTVRTAFLVSIWLSIAVSVVHLTALWSGRSARVISSALALILSVLVFGFVRLVAGEPALALLEVVVLFTSLFILRFAVSAVS